MPGANPTGLIGGFQHLGLESLPYIGRGIRKEDIEYVPLKEKLAAHKLAKRPIQNEARQDTAAVAVTRSLLTPALQMA